eukprot:m.70530 g.70530  ORF g.70530 m.70530 type:complete len:167 (+) comp20091_c0_seq2:686-1186(+)
MGIVTLAAVEVIVVLEAFLYVHLADLPLAFAPRVSGPPTAVRALVHPKKDGGETCSSDLQCKSGKCQTHCCNSDDTTLSQCSRCNDNGDCIECTENYFLKTERCYIKLAQGLCVNHRTPITASLGCVLMVFAATVLWKQRPVLRVLLWGCAPNVPAMLFKLAKVVF